MKKKFNQKGGSLGSGLCAVFEKHYYNLTWSQFHQHFMTSFMYESYWHNFLCLKLRLIHFLAQDDCWKSCSWNVGEIDTRLFKKILVRFQAMETNTTIVNLNLGSNRLGFSSCKYLAEMIRQNKTLKQLDLSCNLVPNSFVNRSKS